MSDSIEFVMYRVFKIFGCWAIVHICYYMGQTCTETNRKSNCDITKRGARIALYLQSLWHVFLGAFIVGGFLHLIKNRYDFVVATIVVGVPAHYGISGTIMSMVEKYNSVYKNHSCDSSREVDADFPPYEYFFSEPTDTQESVSDELPMSPPKPADTYLLDGRPCQYSPNNYRTHRKIRRRNG